MTPPDKSTNDPSPQEAPQGEQPQEPQDFESALKRLEQIVADMEKGEMKLEKLMASYEEGMKLVGYCNKTLNQVEQKIEQLSKQDDSLTTQPVENANEKATEGPKASSAYPVEEDAGSSTDENPAEDTDEFPF